MMLNLKIVLVLLLVCTACGQEEREYKLKDGTTWHAFAGQKVSVTTVERKKEVKVSGVVQRMRPNFVTVSDSLIFIDDITSVEILEMAPTSEPAPVEEVVISEVEEEPLKIVISGYIVIRLTGPVGFIPTDYVGNYTTKYISVNGIAKALKALNSYKKVQHVVFVIESEGGDEIEIDDINRTLSKYKKRFSFYAIVGQGKKDPLSISELVEVLVQNETFLSEGDVGVDGEFEKAKIVFNKEFRRQFWELIVSNIYSVNPKVAYDSAMSQLQHKKPIRQSTPSTIGVELHENWTEYPKKSENSEYAITKNHERQIIEIEREQKKLNNITNVLTEATNAFLALPDLKRIAETTDPNKYEYQTTVVEWYDEYLERWVKTEELTQESKNLWNQRTNDSIANWSKILSTINGNIEDPIRAFGKIIRSEPQNGTHRKIRAEARTEIEEGLEKLQDAYKTAYPLKIVAEQMILSLEQGYK